jgi:hypothetical protein
MAYTFEYKFMNDSFNSKEHASDICEMFISKGIPPWYKNMNTYIMSDKHSYWKHWLSVYNAFMANRISKDSVEREFFNQRLANGSSTIKKCPGIKSLLSTTLVLKAPCEMYIQIKEGRVESTHTADSDLCEIRQHDDSQFKYDNGQVFSNKKNIKFAMGIKFSLNATTVWMPPSYHKHNNNIETLPAVLESDYSYFQELNINTLVDVSIDKDIHIQKGDALAYLWTDSPIKFKFNPNLKDSRVKSRFNQSAKSIFKDTK